MAVRKKAAKKAPPKHPKTIGGCIDRLYKLKQEAAEIRKRLNEKDADYKALKAHIIEELPKSEVDGASGKTAKVNIIKKAFPTATNWDKFYAHVQKKSAFHLLQKRMSAPAFRELWEDGKKIPGVEPYTALDLSITKKS